MAMFILSIKNNSAIIYISQKTSKRSGYIAYCILIISKCVQLVKNKNIY